jgi:ureidoglycolate dehydrogenase (NAD+)
LEFNLTKITKKYHQHMLLKFVQEIFQYYGVSRDHALKWAEVLIWANLRGVDSHGVLRIPVYVDYLQTGIINAQPDMKLDPLTGAIARLDADLGPGPIALIYAMDEAIKKAKKFNIGWCTVCNMTHAGAVGYFALQAAKAGLAGLVMTASQPMMAYPGSTKNVVSTNPLAIAIPGDKHSPLLLDMSTSTVGMGKVLQAQDSGKKIPFDWGLNEKGQPTSDPNKVAVLSPLGGAKGAGLSLMIECLTSLAVNNPLIEPVLKTGSALEGRPINGVAIAVNVEMFGDKESYKEQVDALAAQIKNLPKAEGVDQIFAPGERGDSILAIRKAEGIPLPDGTLDRLRPIGENCGVKLPEPI